jgi:hypothetical protein
MLSLVEIFALAPCISLKVPGSFPVPPSMDPGRLPGTHFVVRPAPQLRFKTDLCNLFRESSDGRLPQDIPVEYVSDAVVRLMALCMDSYSAEWATVSHNFPTSSGDSTTKAHYHHRYDNLKFVKTVKKIISRKRPELP